MSKRVPYGTCPECLRKFQVGDKTCERIISIGKWVGMRIEMVHVICPTVKEDYAKLIEHE